MEQHDIDFKQLSDENKFVAFKAGAGIEISKKHIKPKPKEQTLKVVDKIVAPSTEKEEIPLKFTEEEVRKKVREFIANLPPNTIEQQKKTIEDQMMNLMMQMGSDAGFLSKGRIDERKLAHINDNDQLALGHFNYRGIVDGVRYFQIFVDWLLTSSNSVNGIRSRQFIQLANAYSGTPQQEYVTKPGAIGRYITNRGWERDAREKGQIVID